jgi:hypothetical protein
MPPGENPEFESKTDEELMCLIVEHNKLHNPDQPGWELTGDAHRAFYELYRRHGASLLRRLETRYY